MIRLTPAEQRVFDLLMRNAGDHVPAYAVAVVGALNKRKASLSCASHIVRQLRIKRPEYEFACPRGPGSIGYSLNKRNPARQDLYVQTHPPKNRTAALCRRHKRLRAALSEIELALADLRSETSAQTLKKD